MSFFVTASHIAAERAGEPFARTTSSGTSTWGNISIWNLEAWNAALYPLYMWLYLAGYRPLFVRFKATDDRIVSLNLQTREVSDQTAGEEADVTVGFEPIALADGTDCSVSFAVVPGLVEATYGRAPAAQHMPAVSFASGAEELSFPVLEGFADPASLAEISEWDAARKQENAGYAVLVGKAAKLFETAIGDTLREVWDSQFGIMEPIDKGAPVSPTETWQGKQTLFWLLHPANWYFKIPDANTALLESTAADIWNALLDKGLTELPGYAVHAQGNPLGALMDYASLKGRLFGVHRHRARRFQENLLSHIEEHYPAFPPALGPMLGELDFLELLMLLSKFGVIGIPAIGDQAQSSEEDLADHAPFDFFDVRTNEWVGTKRFELVFFGLQAATLEYENELYGPTYNGQIGKRYDLEDLVCWEYFPPPDYAGAADADIAENPEKHRLVIVAAPGVRIRRPAQKPSNLAVQIIRVQDPGDVPELFTQIDIGMFYAKWQEHQMPAGIQIELVDAEGESQIVRSEDLDAFQLSPLIDGEGDVHGLTLEYPPSELDFHMPVNLTLANTDVFHIKIVLSVDKYSGSQRFGYVIKQLEEPENPSWAKRGSQTDALISTHYHVVSHMTPGVHVAIDVQRPTVNVSTAAYTQRHADFYLYRPTGRGASIADINFVSTEAHTLWYDPEAVYHDADANVPSDADSYLWWWGSSDEHNGRKLYLDSSIRVDRPGQELQPYRLNQAAPDHYDSHAPFWSRIMVDIGVGFIPIVGDAADIYDLSHVLITGRDKWGEPVSGGEFAFMIFCTALPFVGTGAAKLVFKSAP